MNEDQSYWACANSEGLIICQLTTIATGNKRVVAKSAVIYSTRGDTYPGPLAIPINSKRSFATLPEARQFLIDEAEMVKRQIATNLNVKI